MSQTQNNPFTPYFGQIPAHIAGRDVIIEEVSRALGDEPGNPARTSVFVGARGSGKTALLSYFAEESIARGWISVNVSCLPGMQEDILQQVQSTAAAFLPKNKKNRLSSLSIGQLFSASWEKSVDERPNWRTRISALLDVLAEHDTGLLLTIDEVTPRIEEMIQVASVYQLLIRENRKIALLMAGLPAEVSMLFHDRSVSFLRRASQYHLGTIENYEIANAFEKTVTGAGKKIDRQALSMATDAIGGFAYMMQLVGYRSWQESQGQTQIDRKAVKAGITLARKDFESRVLKPTVQTLSSGDKAFLAAMLPDEDISSITDIEKRMRKSSGYVSRYRGRLLESGVIEAVGRGRLRFTLPGIRQYLQEL